MRAKRHEPRLLWLKAQAAVLGLPHYQLAKAVGMAPCRVSLLFNGHLPAGDDELERMSAYLGDLRAEEGLPEVRLVDDRPRDEVALDARATSPTQVRLVVGAIEQILSLDDAQLCADLLVSAISEAEGASENGV